MQSDGIESTALPFHRRNKGAILLVTLLLLILLAPLGQLFKDSKLLDMTLATIVMAASLHAISYRRRSTVYLAAVLATLAVISGWMQVGFDSNVHQILSHSFGAALYLYIAGLLFKVILIEDDITIDQIFAAVAIYIFIGLTWAHFYALADAFQPGSIDFGTATESIEPNISYIYFSFITLTTLGYGDMLPVTAGAKSLVIVEAITGVMFIAVLISTLVGRVNKRR